MKKTIILTIILLATAAFSNVSAQIIPPPPGAGDRNLGDDGIKSRSVELERIERDAKKDSNDKNNKAAQNSKNNQPEDKLAAKYDEIKADFEQIQKSQDAVINAYKTADQADYAEISKSALEINKSAERLDTNLFPPPSAKKAAKKDDEKSEKETKTPKSVRDLIVDLDNTIGSFSTSPMFQNLRVVEPKVSEKTQTDLKKIIELSAALSAESLKSASDKK
ncbi:MAG: hypothetical protein ACR2N3_03000 [Pyrinomonadaceae bacterium]